MDKLLTSATALTRKYGAICSRKIQQRLMELQSVSNLLELSHMQHLQFHALQGDRAGQWSISVVKNNKMTFIEAVEPVPLLPDGSVDLAAITAVRIIDPCVDYH